MDQAKKIKMSEIRDKFPMYADVSDEQLLSAVHKKFYNDLPIGNFLNAVDFDTERERAKQELLGSMSTTEKVLAGAGKSFADIGRSAEKVGAYVGDFFSPRQMTLSNLVKGDKPKSRVEELQQQLDEQARLDEALMSSTAGKVGNVIGDLALTAVPGYRLQQGLTRGAAAAASMLPRAAAAVTRGAAPYIGAAGSGAAVGAATTPSDMAGGAGMGALAGGVGEAGGRVLSAAYQGAKAAIDPLTEAGRQRVLKRTLERFATDPNKLRDPSLIPSNVTVPGRMPQLAPGTLAEATMDPGIAQLQRAAGTASPDVASALQQARGQQVASYRNILDELAGNDGKRAFYEADREAVANQLYSQARAEPLQMTQQLQGQVNALMKRPSIQSAIVEAKRLAKEKGVNIADPKGSTTGLMYVDKALGDQIESAMRAGNGNLASALKNTQDELRSFLDQAAPAYGAARRTYQEMSAPINQMAIGQELRNKAIPALDDLSNNALARVNANSYANALRNADKTAAQATGLRSAKMGSVLDPDQMRAVQGIGEDMARYASVQEMARAPGSPTAQYLGAQNIIRQMLGPLGLPQSAADSMAGRIAASVMSFPFRITQSQTEQLLARALTEPGVAAKIMAAKDPKTIAEILRPYAAQAAIQMDIQE